MVKTEWFQRRTRTRTMKTTYMDLKMKTRKNNT